MSRIARPRLDHASLERAIYEGRSIGDLTGDHGSPISPYRVVDYVGSFRIDPGREPQDLIHATAQQFFEAQGAHMETLIDSQRQRDFHIALFTTFIVVEIRPLTSRAEFLVLAPPRPSGDAPTPYLGLVRSQNTDALREVLARAETRREVFEAIERLLRALEGRPRGSRARPGLLRRLLGRE